MAFTAPEVQVFANAGPRISHLDSKGGGTITRLFYVEPYLAHPWVELFLKGTVAQIGGGPNWGRIKPHSDPIKPLFYCSDVQVHPFSAETVTGQALTLYHPSNDFSYNPGGTGGQQSSINNVLNAVDDQGYTNIVDFGLGAPLNTAQIQAGGIPVPGGSNAYSGKCGAIVVATYTPLIFLDGSLTSGIDAFDVVNPIRSSTEIATQTGRSLFVYSPNVVRALADAPLYLAGAAPLTAGFVALAKFAQAAGIASGNGGNAGLSDTFSKPETIFKLQIRRLMIPFLPQLTEAAYKSKINQVNNATLGNLKFPKWTIRFDHMDYDLNLAPDGQTYYNLTLNFSIRLLWEDVYDDLPDGTTIDGAASPAFKSIKSWVTWNHHYAIPADRILGVQVGSAGYYPVTWNAGAFQLFGAPRLLYLGDGQASQPPGYAGTLTGAMLTDLFTSGFQLGQ